MNRHPDHPDRRRRRIRRDVAAASAALLNQGLEDLFLLPRDARYETLRLHLEAALAAYCQFAPAGSVPTPSLN